MILAFYIININKFIERQNSSQYQEEDNSPSQICTQSQRISAIACMQPVANSFLNLQKVKYRKVVKLHVHLGKYNLVFIFINQWHKDVCLLIIHLMTDPASSTHWSNRRFTDYSFKVSDDLFQALDHIPNPTQNLYDLTFSEYCKKMIKVDPQTMIDLAEKLNQIQLKKRLLAIKQQVFADNTITLAQKYRKTSWITPKIWGEESPQRRAKQRITDEVANQVLELSKTIGNTSQISRLCRISRGSVSKILKNRPQDQ